MKRYTSRFLKAVALIYLCFPVLHLTFIGILFNIPLTSWIRILLSPFYYVVAFFAMITGYGLWEMRRWSWHLLLFTNIAVIYENALIANDYGESHNNGLAFLVSVIILLALVYRIAREVRVPYFFPKIRWWESNPRYRLSVPVKLTLKPLPALPGHSQGKTEGPESPQGREIVAEILDLSMGGCFIKVREPIGLDERLELSFQVFGVPLECLGVVVWRTQSTVTHPRGMGVKFQLLTRPQKKTLKLITRKLRLIANHYRKSRYLMNQEDFLKKLEEIEEATRKTHELPHDKQQAPTAHGS